MNRERCQSRPGFTLLEVILALAVLAVALSIVGEANRMAQVTAEKAAAESEATMIAESVLAELSIGTMPLSNVTNVSWEEVGRDPAWQYSVVVEQTEFTGLYAAQVKVTQLTQGQSTSANSLPIGFAILRWIVDPQADETEESDTTDSTTSSSGTSGASS